MAVMLVVWTADQLVALSAGEWVGQWAALMVAWLAAKKVALKVER